MLKQLLKRKNISQITLEADDEQHGLKRVLGPLDLVSLGIGIIIGAGIFVVTGQAAAQYAGPAISLSFVLSGFGCVFAGLCYAEMASMIPVSGSAYTYAYATLGQFIAWVIGWDLVLEYLFASSTVSVGWSGYVVSFLKDFGIFIPDIISRSPLSYDPHAGWAFTGAVINLPAILIVLAAMTLLTMGIRESAAATSLIVIIKLTVLLVFIGVGFFYINRENWQPFIPPNEGTFGHFGWSGVLRGAGVIFFAYIGFDAVSTAAQETRNPQRNVPIGILGSLVVATVLYIVVALVLTGVVKYSMLNVPDPIAVAVDFMGEKLYWLRPLIKIGAIAGLTSVIIVLLFGQTRIFYSMARDKMLPGRFAALHPVYRTPIFTTILTGVAASFFAGIFPIGILGELVSIGTLLAFVIVCVGVLALRYTDPQLPRPFKVPLFPLVPILGAGVSFLQMAALPMDTWLRLIVWMLIGFVIYFLYSRKRAVS
ncbi:MAG: amino acid permease [Candidatus Dadabacteria bacterium RIFCSPHIGHO2_12_FULL_53_21]|nr:MAG: amino acid permease [Candidatus Dadabacteria bacterium RIFCSPHIGHO2_12_FULL_53_21]